MRTETELIKKAQAGSIPAFEELIREYDSRVLSIALKYTNSEQDAKDIYQDVFIRVFRNLKGFEFRSEFSTWLYRITVNVCMTWNTKAKRQMHYSLDQTVTTDDGDEQPRYDVPDDRKRPDEVVIGSEIMDKVNEAIDGLSPKQKIVFTMKHFEGLKLREIADALDCTEGTVKRYLFTATRKLRAELGGLMGFQY